MTTAKGFISQQLGTAGWAPINYGMAAILCPGTRLYQARVEGFGLAPVETHEGDSAIEKARNLLASMLKDGPRDAAEIRTAAEGAKISERTIQRAADTLGVVKTKVGLAGGCIWALPVTEPVTA